LLGLDLQVQFIQGNGDREVLAVMRGQDPVTVPVQFQDVVRWTADQLNSEHEREIDGWPKTLRVFIGGFGEVMFCHATPRNDTDIFTKLTAEERLLPIFEGLGVSIVVCGHTHMQFDRMIGRTRVVNAGSAGMPFGKPGAYWLLLGPDVQLRQTNYDLALAASRIRDTRYPHAEDFAANNVLQPPTEKAVLESFTLSELR
jgi:predicted phosphodiesterase